MAGVLCNVTCTDILLCSFKADKILGAFYSGGQVELSRDGQHLFATCGSTINVVSCSSGLVEKSIEEVI